MNVGVEIVDEKPLVARVLPDIFKPVYVNELAAQHRAVGADQVGIGRIDGQNRVVLLRIRTEQKKRSTVQPQFQLRQKPRVMEIDAVGVSCPRDDVTPRVEQRKEIAGFQGARAVLLK